MSLGRAPASDLAIIRKSLTSAVADRLRDQVIRGEFSEGTQIRQDAIAARYHVSRIPVREALRQLDAEGLIAIVPNRGAVVPALSPKTLRNSSRFAPCSNPRCSSSRFLISPKKTCRRQKQF